MAIYEYRCAQHGLFEIIRPCGTAPVTAVCSVCSLEAARAISAPMVRSPRRTAWTAALDRAERSRYEPEVVTSLPPDTARRRARTAPLTPALRGLPRP